MTKVMTCTCSHKDQDELHGNGNRVHNRGIKSNIHFWRCTVCRKEKGNKEESK